MLESIKRRPLLIEAALLVLLTGLVFLPFAFRLTYHRDDWYYMLDGLFNGPLVYHRMFEGDRPLRGYFFRIYFTLFGLWPLAYHLGMYLWRLVAAFAGLWLFRILWPGHRRATFLMALMLALYPGYSWWVAGVEHQPMMASLALQALSLALTLQAVRARRAVVRLALLAASLATGWLYIGLVDYAIGMEALRFLAVFLLVRREAGFGSNSRAARESLRRAGLTLLIPLGFLVWKQFFFENQRSATDIGIQLGRLLDAPLSTGMAWAMHLFQSVLGVGLVAWVGPFYQFASSRPVYFLLAALPAAALAALAANRPDRFPASDDRSEAGAFAAEAIGLGLAGIFCGVLPVIAANRSVVYPGYSHYGLPASLAAAMLVVGLASLMRSPQARLAAISTLAGMACVAHLQLGQNELAEQRSISGFWRQMAWRVPGFADGTTLAANYAGVVLGDDRASVWGPANLIYEDDPDSRRTPDGDILYGISAAILDNKLLNDLAAGQSRDQAARRGHILVVQYSRLLVVTQPDRRACVRVIDARWPEISSSDSAMIRWLAPYSRLEQVIPDGAAPELPGVLFGAEPVHGWCYYYEKAELARQAGDWQAIADLHARAESLALQPADAIEWMPFLQAFAALGDGDMVESIAGRINAEAFYKAQACNNLRAMPAAGYALAPGMQEQIDGIFCNAGR